MHRCWRANRTRCRRYNMWMASHSSPRVSTARILLSNAYNSKPVFNFFIGITTALDAQSLAASLFERTERNPVIAFELDARYGHSALGRWVSHFGGLDWQLVLRHIDFRYPQMFTCCVNHKEASIYDSSSRRISTLELPLLWRINSRAPIRAFVGISVPEGEVLPSPSLLSLGYVQPLMTPVSESRFLLPRLQAYSSNTVVISGCGDSERSTLPLRGGVLGQNMLQATFVSHGVPAKLVGGAKKNRGQCKSQLKPGKVSNQQSNPRSALLVKPDWLNKFCQAQKPERGYASTHAHIHTNIHTQIHSCVHP